MKKSLLIIMVFFIVLFGANSCKKVGVPDVTLPSLLEITSASLAGSYFIENIASTEYKILIGTTTISSVDRKISITYTSPSGAENGVQYTAPASITIPAGKALDTLRIKGIFAGYPQGRKDKLSIKISSVDLPSFAGKDTFLLTLQKFCPVVVDDFYGDYDNTWDNGSYGPYTTGVVDGSAVSTGPTSGTIKVSNIWDYGLPSEVTVNLDWSDPDPVNYQATIADQEYIASEDLWIKGAGVGTFVSCDQTFELKYTLYFKATGEIFRGDQVTILAR